MVVMRKASELFGYVDLDLLLNKKQQTMAFIYLNKQTKEALIFGSITSLCRYTGLKKDNFYTHFGRLNNTEFENENVRIIKTEIKRGGK